MEGKASAEHVLVYDGGCGLCRAAVVWIASRGPVEAIRAVDYHDAAAMALLPVTYEEADRSVYLLSEGVRHKGYRAVVEVLRLLPRYRRWVPLLRTWPLRVVGGAGYRAVSANRHWISRVLGLEG